MLKISKHYLSGGFLKMAGESLPLLQRFAITPELDENFLHQGPGCDRRFDAKDEIVKELVKVQANEGLERLGIAMAETIDQSLLLPGGLPSLKIIA